MAMKMKPRIWVITGIATLLMVSGVFAQEKPVQKTEETDSLDLAKIKIESPEVRRFLKTDFISVKRKKTSFIPQGELPIIKLEKVNDDICQRRLQEVIQRHTGKDRRVEEINDHQEIMAAKAESAFFWIHRASGSYKFTETKQSMSIRQTKIDHFKKAVQRALDYTVKHRLIKLSPGEEIDVLFVSGVKNALAVAKEAKPVEEFVSDYYVGFGRRFHGIPIIGSKLVIRFNGNGEVVMVEKNWRQIIGVSDQKAVVSEMALAERIARNPDIRKRYDLRSLRRENITVVDAQCGYMEAPVDYVQEYLRPGCSVSFQVGKGGDETLPQIFIPLEEGVSMQKLWGRKYREVKKTKAENRDVSD